LFSHVLLLVIDHDNKILITNAAALTKGDQDETKQVNANNATNNNFVALIKEQNHMH
jgi:hypothetical protein